MTYFKFTSLSVFNVYDMEMANVLFYRFKNLHPVIIINTNFKVK